MFTTAMLAQGDYTKVPTNPAHFHFYVYYFKSGRYLFDRTCGSGVSAEDRVKELNKRGYHAVYLLNHLIKGAFH